MWAPGFRRGEVGFPGQSEGGGGGGRGGWRTAREAAEAAAGTPRRLLRRGAGAPKCNVETVAGVTVHKSNPVGRSAVCIPATDCLPATHAPLRPERWEAARIPNGGIQERGRSTHAPRPPLRGKSPAACPTSRLPCPSLVSGQSHGALAACAQWLPTEELWLFGKTDFGSSLSDGNFRSRYKRHDSNLSSPVLNTNLLNEGGREEKKEGSHRPFLLCHLPS